jgi:ADP-heptose:LPS heptosyltransferase
MKVVILKRDKIGDMLLVTPMLRHLRASLPGAQIHMLANDYNAWVLEGNRDIDRLWVYPRVRHGASVRPRALFEQLWQLMALRRERFDFAIAAGGVVSPRAAARILKLGARRSVAFAGAGPDGDAAVFDRLTDALPYDGRRHEVESNLALLEPLGIAPPAAPVHPRYRLGREWRDPAERWTAEQGLEPGRFVVIGLNARRAKRKPTTEQILAWSEWLHRERGLASVLIWQPGPADDRVYPGDDEIVHPFIGRLPPWLKPFANPADVRAALGVIWQAATSIFPDGGIAHLASVSPGGVLALFAETDVSPHPDNWRPYTPRSAYLEAKKTVAELTDAQIFERVDWLLSQPLQEA